MMRIVNGHQPVDGHSLRVAGYAGHMGGLLGLSQMKVADLVYAARRHDEGKRFIPSRIWNKQGPLTPGERKASTRHTIYGCMLELLRGTLNGNPPRHAAAASTMLFHHENFAGRQPGYFGLCGRQIPFFSRVVKVVDVYDALREQRPYKEGMPHVRVVAAMTQGMGSVHPDNFDPALLSLFLDHADDFRAIRARMLAQNGHSNGHSNGHPPTLDRLM